MHAHPPHRQQILTARRLCQVDVHKLKKIFDLFELTTGVDAIIQQGDGMVEYSDFCALLESKVSIS